jgi:tRNA-Thr(GGU) m(6)t(6)A37 methyltransferase TsaA
MLSLTGGLLLPVPTQACGPKSEAATSQAMSSKPDEAKAITAGKAIIMNPIGRVIRQDDRVFIDIFPEYAPALEGLSGFSHVWVLFWFHGNDTPEKRAILKVHPRKDPANPLTGVFATRAPVRPNLIGFTPCRLLKVEGLRLEMEGLDAWPDTPILDMKPYIPGSDSLPEAKVPGWVKRLPKKTD